QLSSTRFYHIRMPRPSDPILFPYATLFRSRSRDIYDRRLYLEGGVGFNSKLFGYARTLVRGAAERSKPNEQRLREYAESNLPKRSEEHTSELQSRENLVCRLLLEKKNQI